MTPAALALAAVATTSASSPSSPSSLEVQLGPVAVRPLATLQIDARLPVHDLGKDADIDLVGIEGQPGFVIARGRLGLAAKSGPFSLSLIGEGAREKVGLLEAQGNLDLADGFVLSAGLMRTPLFSGPDALVTQPIQERSALERTFWPGRELGVMLRAAPDTMGPVRPEAWLRIGNGQPNAVLGNDNAGLAGDARVDVVVGDLARAGVAARVEDTDAEPGIAGTTPLNFQFWRPPPTSGLRSVMEAHVLVAEGPLRVWCAGTYAVENRAVDDDGDPTTAKVTRSPIAAAGGSAEVSWMVVGNPRVGGLGAPADLSFASPSVEVALRGERLWLGLPADATNVDDSVEPGGATVGTADVTWWMSEFVSLAGQVHAIAYDTAPLEDPTRTHSLIAMARLNFSLR